MTAEFEAMVGRLGERGIAGAQIIQVADTPAGELGNDGDFAILFGPGSDTTLYGPKADGAWGAGRSIRGAQGPTGPQGAVGPQGELGPQGAVGPQGAPGYLGWSPVLVPVEVTVGEDQVLVWRLIDWIGGQGDPPAEHVGAFVNAAGDGFTEDAGAARQVGGAVVSAASVTFDNGGVHLPGSPSNAQAAIHSLAAHGWRFLGVQWFTSSEPDFALAGDVGLVIAELIGGGGGGGGANGATSETAAAGGGSSGSYHKAWIPWQDWGASQNLIIGAGGTGGPAGSTGGTGGTTSIGSLVDAPGGVGGPSMSPSTTVTRGRDPSPADMPDNTGFTILRHNGFQGEGGIRFSGTYAIPGRGAPSPLGGGQVMQPATSANGAAATTPGGGGTGCLTTSGTNRIGGAGANGIIILHYFAKSAASE